MLMENPERPLDKPLPPEKELMHFKAVVRSVMLDASKVLANIELLVHGADDLPLVVIPLLKSLPLSK
jgi:hypothetical protein